MAKIIIEATMNGIIIEAECGDTDAKELFKLIEKYEASVRERVKESKAALPNMGPSMNMPPKNLIKKEDIKEEICNSIIPNEKMRMTQEAFQLVYPKQDTNLEAELKEKLRPSKERKQTITKIKEECYKRT